MPSALKSGRSTTTKKSDRAELERVAQQLAKVKLTAIAEGDQIFLRAKATFTTRKFKAGNYDVSVGLNQAVLHLHHPSFDSENAYQASLAPETWSETWKKTISSHASLEGHAKAQLGFLRWFGLGGEAKGKTDRDKAAEQNARTPYRIVSITPTGWRIGTDLGDPRSPEGALPRGLEHCLNGEYLSGRVEEHGDGAKDKSGVHALCILKVNQTGNDPRIVATLFGTTGSLKIAITLSDTVLANTTLKQDRERTEREETLRRTFVEICLQRAEAAYKAGGQTDQAVSGEFYLSHDEIHAPKLSAPIPVKGKAQDRKSVV